MHDSSSLEDIPLPKDWPQAVKTAVIHSISLAHAAIIWTRSWAVNSPMARVRLAGQLDQTKSEISLPKEEIRIKDARMRKIQARHRPFYPATERMAILELRAAQGWSLAQTARRFLVEPETISSWMARVDEAGQHALVGLPEPVNKFPDYVQHIVRRLKVLCPTMGKKRMAETLARAGLHLGVTTVARMLKAGQRRPTAEPARDDGHTEEPELRVVTAKHPNHVWHVDLTVVPTSAGFWVPWMPFSLPQVWPFCWWVALALDHFSRRVVGFAIFTKEPTCVQIRAFLGRAIHKVGVAPKYTISDKGPQFWCQGFKKWCKRRQIKPRFGAAGQYGSIAVIERFIRSLKSEGLRRILIPLELQKMRTELSLYITWYNEHRPSQALGGRTPDEAYHCLRPANRQLRYEPRTRWPTKSRCAEPRAKIKASRGVRLELRVGRFEGRKHLSVVELSKAA
ncbi:transposase [Verrucomicrobiota bacterium]